MPEMDGWMRCDKNHTSKMASRSKDNCCNVLKHFREICLAAGADDFLTKPFGLRSESGKRMPYIDFIIYAKKFGRDYSFMRPLRNVTK